MKDYIYLNPLLQETDYENFKSDVCQFLKRLGDREFLLIALSENWVPIFFETNEYEKAFYILAITDYLSEKHNLVPFSKYEQYRKKKLQRIIYPKDVLLTDTILKTDRKKELVEEMKKNPVGRYFIRYNIVEDDIQNVI